MARVGAKNSVQSSRLTLMAALVVVVAAAVGGRAFAATKTTYTLKNLSATVTGTSVTATATVAASARTTAQYAGVCVRDTAGSNLDFGKASNVVLTTAGTVLNAQAKTFAAGTYSYFACVEVSNVWYQAGSTQTFTVAGSGSGTTTPPSGSSYGNNALAQWNAALANRNTTPVTWVAWGDSITEGQGASSIQNRWVNQTLNDLRAHYPTTGVTGGLGYEPSYYATYWPDSAWTPFSSEGGSIYDDTWGSLGERIADMGQGGYETYTVTGTSADIMYAVGSGGGMFSYQVDSGGPVSVDTMATDYTAAARTHVSFAGGGTHTLTVTSTSGTVYFEGIMAYSGDENKGIRLYEGAHSGATTDDFMNSVWDLADITGSAKADLVTIELGPNDFAQGSETPAGVTANLQSMISDVRAVSWDHEPSIVVVVSYGFSPGYISSPLGYSWQQYADAIRAVANADPSVGLLDLTSFGTASGTPGGLFASDGLHPSDAGQAQLAAMVESYLEDQ